MKKILVTLLLFSTSIITSIAQNRSLDSLFDAGNYEACLQYISRNTAVDLSMKKVECLIRLNRLVEAENILIKHKETLPEILANKALLIGQVYLNKGFLNEAITAFEEAEKRFQTQRDAFKLSEVYSQMGMANWSEGNLEAALTFLHKALSIRISTYGEKHIYTASIYNNIGLVEDSRSNHDEAIKNYHLYQDAYIQKYGINHPAVATGFNNLGLVAKEEKNYKEALQLVQQSLSIRSIIYGENHSNTAFCIVTKGEIFNEMHANDSAIFYFNKALIIYQKLYGEHHPEIAALYNSLASANVANGRYKAALQLYQKALFANSNSFVSVQKWDKNPRAEDYRNPNIMLYTLLGKTEVLYKLYTEKSLNISHLKYALLAIQAADSLVDISRQLKADKNDKLGLGKIASEIYEHAIAISFKLADVTLQPGKYLNLAFYYSEKNKAATLMGAIAETDAKKFAGIPEALLLLENEIKINLNYFENIQATTPSHENHDSLFVYKNRYAALIKDLESKYPAYYQLKYAVNVPEVNEVSKLVDNNGLVLSYALSDKFMCLLLAQTITLKLKSTRWMGISIKTSTHLKMVYHSKMKRFLSCMLKKCMNSYSLFQYPLKSNNSRLCLMENYACYRSNC
jgi:tetratricopeptide (TPR) repeat protein